MLNTSIPPVKWAQRKDKLFLTIDVPNLKDLSFDVTAEGKLTFKYIIIFNLEVNQISNIALNSNFGAKLTKKSQNFQMTEEMLF